MMEKFSSLSDFVNFALFFIKAVSVTLTAFSVKKQAENSHSGGDEVVLAGIRTPIFVSDGCFVACVVGVQAPWSKNDGLW